MPYQVFLKCILRSLWKLSRVWLRYCTSPCREKQKRIYVSRLLNNNHIPVKMTRTAFGTYRKEPSKHPKHSLKLVGGLCILKYLPVSLKNQIHGIWKSHRKSHSILRAKRATFTKVNQKCQRLSILASFWKPEPVLPERSNWLKMHTIRKLFKWDIFDDANGLL